MTVTVLKLSDADAYLKNISIRSIKDVRALDVDLMLVLVNGDRIPSDAEGMKTPKIGKRIVIVSTLRRR